MVEQQRVELCPLLDREPPLVRHGPQFDLKGSVIRGQDLLQVSRIALPLGVTDMPLQQGLRVRVKLRHAEGREG